MKGSQSRQVDFSLGFVCAHGHLVLILASRFHFLGCTSLYFHTNEFLPRSHHYGSMFDYGYWFLSLKIQILSVFFVCAGRFSLSIVAVVLRYLLEHAHPHGSIHPSGLGAYWYRFSPPSSPMGSGVVNRPMWGS